MATTPTATPLTGAANTGMPTWQQMGWHAPGGPDAMNWTAPRTPYTTPITQGPLAGGTMYWGAQQPGMSAPASPPMGAPVSPSMGSSVPPAFASLFNGSGAGAGSNPGTSDLIGALFHGASSSPAAATSAAPPSNPLSALLGGLR